MFGFHRCIPLRICSSFGLQRCAWVLSEHDHLRHTTPSAEQPAAEAPRRLVWGAGAQKGFGRRLWSAAEFFSPVPLLSTVHRSGFSAPSTLRWGCGGLMLSGCFGAHIEAPAPPESPCGAHRRARARPRDRAESCQGKGVESESLGVEPWHGGGPLGRKRGVQEGQ